MIFESKTIVISHVKIDALLSREEAQSVVNALDYGIRELEWELPEHERQAYDFLKALQEALKS